MAFDTRVATLARPKPGAKTSKPRFKKEIVRDIILNGGQKFLSPERRLDAILVSSPDLFSDAGDAAIPNFVVEDAESDEGE